MSAAHIASSKLRIRHPASASAPLSANEGIYEEFKTLRRAAVYLLSVLVKFIDLSVAAGFVQTGAAEAADRRLESGSRMRKISTFPHFSASPESTELPFYFSVPLSASSNPDSAT